MDLGRRLGWGPVLVLLLACAPVTAAWGDRGVRLDGEERVRAIERLQEQHKAIHAVRMMVVQRKQHPLLKTAGVSQGTLLFQRPDRLRWDIRAPERTIVVLDRPTLVIYRPDRKEAERRDLRGDFVARAALEFLVAGMSLAVPELEKRFEVELFQDGGTLTFALTPRSQFMAQAVSSITLTLESADGLPHSVVIVGRKGDRTETTFTNILVNPPVPNDAFALHLGPDVRIIDANRPDESRDGGR